MNAADPQPWWCVLLLRVALPTGPIGASVRGDLHQEFVMRARRHSLRVARAWYRRQSLSVVWSAVRDRIRRQPWGVPRDRRSTSGRPPEWFGSFRGDLRDAFRTVRRAPAYAVAVVLTFALAVGVNVAVFSVVNGVLLKPLPYLDPDRLVTVKRRSVDGGVQDGISGPDYRDYRDRSSSFANISAYSSAREIYFGERAAEEWLGVETTPELFLTLGVAPQLGRVFHPDVDPPRDGSGIVLSDRLWRQRFGGDSSVVGRSLIFEDRSLTVIGVMPPGFYFPTSEADYWAPFGDRGFLDNRAAWFLRVVGRLAAGIDLPVAQTELAGIAARIDAGPEGDPDAAGIALETRHQAYVGHTRTLFGILLAAVGVVLAIACSNIAGLGLTRAAKRHREFVIRHAIGAGRRRLIRQLLTESLVFALAGGLAGIGVAHLAVRVLFAIRPPDLPRAGEIAIDPVALSYALAITTLCGVAFGLVPAWQGTRSTARQAASSGRGGLTAGRHRTLHGLVISQVALSAVLLVAGGLLLNSFVRLSAVQPGFDTANTLTMEIHLPRPRYPSADAVWSFHDDLRARLTAMPAVRRLGFTSHLPFSSSDIEITYFLPGEGPDVERKNVQVEVVTGSYFAAMGIPLLDGRTFRPSDRPDRPLVALINEAMVNRHWPGESPIGRMFSFGADQPPIEVIGVLGTVLKTGLHDERRPVAYFSLPQFLGYYGFVSGRNGFLAINTGVPPATMADDIARGIASLDPQITVTNIRTTAALIADSVAEPRFRTVLIGAFAALAVGLALIGVYAVMGFVVAERRQEIGVRMALGASEERILSQVLSRGGVLVAIGLALGAGGALAVTRTLSGMLFGVTPHDLTTFVVVGGGLSIAALAACYLPAKWASSVHPLEALRESG